MNCKNRPNILLITSDQQHWNTLGVFNKQVKTPCLDRLAAEGTLFTRAYCPNPTCTPTRASIITGQYPSRHGAWSLGTRLPETTHTVGEELSNNGYKTALVGKAHFQPLRGNNQFPSLESYPIMQNLDFWKEFHGPFYGFDHIELARNHADEPHVGQHYAIWMEENGCLNWRDYFRPPTGNNNNQIHKWGIPEEYHYNAWIAEKTNQLLSDYKRNDDNFFLWASFFDPHPPYLAPEPWDSMYNPDEIDIPSVLSGEHDNNPPHFALTQQTSPDFSQWNETNTAIHGMHSHLVDKNLFKKDIAVYYGMISLMDKYIGKILDKLDELKLADNTIIVFTTDHGHFLGQHGLAYKGPFHYEDLVKVPFIAKYSGNIPAGSTSNSLISLVDLAPTFLSYAGIDIPSCMTGIDQKNT